jgi:hypothetical protein
MADELRLCTERPFPALSACVREAEHEGRCVFCRGTADGGALTFYEPTPRGAGFKALIRADLKPGERLNRTEAAALFAYLEAARSST